MTTSRTDQFILILPMPRCVSSILPICIFQMQWWCWCTFLDGSLDYSFNIGRWAYVGWESYCECSCGYVIYTLEPRDDWRTCDCWNFLGISILRAAIVRISGTRVINLNMLLRVWVCYRVWAEHCTGTMNTVWAVSHISICGNYFQICCIGSTTAEPEKYLYNLSAE